MKMIEDTRLLDHKRRVDAERRERAISKRRQEMLRRITPGIATPGTVFGSKR